MLHGQLLLTAPLTGPLLMPRSLYRTNKAMKTVTYCIVKVLQLDPCVLYDFHVRKVSIATHARATPTPQEAVPWWLQHMRRP
jgi:hypothetical protein